MNKTSEIKLSTHQMPLKELTQIYMKALPMPSYKKSIHHSNEHCFYSYTRTAATQNTMVSASHYAELWSSTGLNVKPQVMLGIPVWMSRCLVIGLQTPPTMMKGGRTHRSDWVVVLRSTFFFGSFSLLWNPPYLHIYNAWSNGNKQTNKQRQGQYGSISLLSLSMLKTAHGGLFPTRKIACETGESSFYTAMAPFQIVPIGVFFLQLGGGGLGGWGSDHKFPMSCVACP